MSELIVIGYDDQASATQAYNQVLTLAKDFIVKLTGLAIVTVDAEGKSHVETPQKIVGVSAASGALWGMLIGLLFFVPGVGLLLGGAMGALFGKLGKTGVNDQFRSQVQDMLKPGAAAVVIMADKITEDKFADAWTFDVRRNPNPQIGFGAGGAHFCLGANLARREIAVAFDELRNRVPDIEVAAEPEMLHSPFVHGIKRLPVEWTPPA